MSGLWKKLRMGRELTENSGSATEGLSSNYSAKQRDANAPERDMRSSIYRRSTICKTISDFSLASTSETWYLETNLCHLRAAALRRRVEQERARLTESGWWIERILAIVNIASL